MHRQSQSFELLSKSFNGLDSPYHVEFSQRLQMGASHKKRARPGKIGLSDEGLDAAARRLISVRGAQLLGVLSISVASPLGKGYVAPSPLSLLNSKCR
jgi:hypothetical protein